MFERPRPPWQPTLLCNSAFEIAVAQFEQNKGLEYDPCRRAVRMVRISLH